MNICRLCKTKPLKILYEMRDIPIFQNKVYPTAKNAESAKTGNLALAQCQTCGFLFNCEFNQGLMHYDADYQNEQAQSGYFREYLNEIIGAMGTAGFLSGKIIEIGCGKGYFLNLLRQNGYAVTGFDPAYEGDNPNIIKDYYSIKYNMIQADSIILRHTLEHIQNPLEFLNSIAVANNYHGKLFIEVPCFDWIVKKKAFWDIYYEHCNYFTMETLRSLFSKSHVGKHFGDQYLHLIADLNDLKAQVRPGKNDVERIDPLFTSELQSYKQFVAASNKLFVWGAGAKGITFVNMVDPKTEFIDGLIDINPKKQNRFVAKTAHKIYGIEALSSKKIKNILIMNENYFNEIETMVSNHNILLFTLGVL